MDAEERDGGQTAPSEEVFISYSWDGEGHVRRVLNLSNQLRSEGVDCVLDQYESSPPEGWPRWMDRKIREARFVLVVCTEQYYRKVMGQEPEDSGVGVKWEGNLIYQHLYNAGTQNSKFIPVLFDSRDQRFIPTPLQGATRYRVDTRSGYDDLYCRLIGRPRAEKPSLGRRRALPQKEVKTDITAYLSAPIDVDLWNKARWKSTFFIVSKSGSEPPMLGIGFLRKRPAEQIFEQWHRRYGNRDLFEELRVSIIEGDIPGKHPGYSVHIGPDVGNTIERYRAAGLAVRPDTDLFISVGRINRMNPAPTSKNLEMFKDAYRRLKQYVLVPGVVKPDGSGLQVCRDAGILKREIKFRAVSDIGSDDEDSAVLG